MPSHYRLAHFSTGADLGTLQRLSVHTYMLHEPDGSVRKVTFKEAVHLLATSRLVPNGGRQDGGENA